MKLTSFLTSALLGGLVFFAAGSALAAEAKIPMVTFHSPSRGDYFTTSQTNWTCWYFNNCAPGTPDFRGDYVAVGMQGHIWNPDNPQPANTTPLFHWFSGTRADNFLTTDPAWAGSVGTLKDGYVLFRIEGFVAQSGSSGLALNSYWNASVADNAALTTWQYVKPAGYGWYRTEGYLLPPDNATCTGTPNFTDPSSWQARANYVDSWAQPQDFLGGDRVMFTAPQEQYTIDYWGHQYSTRGHIGSSALSDYPAPGRPIYALLARVTTGRAFVAGGWYEAGVWFQALGSQQDWNGPCIFYDATGVTPGALETRFNDPNISDNSGAANVKIRQWW
ncbi:hypothetical protein SAMN02745121_01778 [Nannocystis exedens]|uniref:Uncharacterized protein n=1 Tax=Nannocystis exedens TaxID=54 RepID=A0A1I1VMF6_9BACT|nr:hypothetical protein [Nannocystis exedens]PCC72663.1 hypothetical protein NAEX_05746 [Nannocystis exedens]SFD84081.1 hypothetical protein SAMN02745121_01778 [Nannocystis exedens]